MVAKLQGKKRLSLGNHDRITSKSYLQNYFEEINLWYIFTEHNFVLTHVPTRLSELRQSCILNVYGHNHKGRDRDPRFLNVCVENWNYKPVHLDEILKRVRILKAIDEGSSWYWLNEELHPILDKITMKHFVQSGF